MWCSLTEWAPSISYMEGAHFFFYSARLNASIADDTP